MSLSTKTSDPMSCRQVWEEMNEMLSKTTQIRNYSRRIQMGRRPQQQDAAAAAGTDPDADQEPSYTIITDLFPLAALRVYSAYNLEEPIHERDQNQYFSAHRGGSQGDYREGMKAKIDNVVDCLHRYPRSKRAVITVPNDSFAGHESDDDAKCMREIHFYLDPSHSPSSDDADADADADLCVLNATVWMRAQAAEIFPKNIHFVGSLMDRVARELSLKRKQEEGKRDGRGSVRGSVRIGELYYLATTLVSVRED